MIDAIEIKNMETRLTCFQMIETFVRHFNIKSLEDLEARSEALESLLYNIKKQQNEHTSQEIHKQAGR